MTRLFRILLAFLGLTMVACGSDAAPSTPTLAARAGIAPTPSPTQVVQPTATAAEVVPTAPTTTPVPTAIATPTPIPTPTRTPRPTRTPTRTPQPTHTPLPVTLTLKCSDEWFIQAIIDLSEDREGRIIKIYTGAVEIERSKSILRCRSEARSSRGGDVYLVYHYEIDRGGDSFIGYSVAGFVSTPTPESTATPTPTATPASTATPTPTPPPALGSRQNPVPLGTTIEIRGEADKDHWEATVLSRIPDATAMVLDENRFNDPPKEGKQFYIVRIRARYLGAASNEFDGRYRLKAVGAGGVVYTASGDSCGVIPDRLRNPELFTNGTVEGNQCWQIASTDADSLLVFLEPEGWSDEKRTWFSLAGRAQSSSTPTPTATPTQNVISTPADLVERVKDGVVRVVAGFFSSGSGFIFDIEGTTAFVATNYHVIEDADAVDVTVSGTHTYEALVLGWDADRDVAVLAICCSDSFVALPWEEASPDVGAQVVAVGYPRGGSRSQVTATTGVVAMADALSTRLDFIPHTAPLNPGNSGGPLFSMPEAKVLGINTARGTEALIFYAVPFQAIEGQMAEWRSQLVVTQ